MRPIRNVVSTCTLKDAETWYYSSQAIHRYIEAENYYLIAPTAEVAVFEAISPPEFRVVSEDTLLNGLSLDYIVQRMPAGNRSRASWYFQQFIKLASLITLESDPDDLLLIWDADNVPVRPLSFCNSDGHLIYRSSNGYHPPYFAMIERLLGLKKTGDCSFIAQCFPIWRRWMTEFVSCVERRSHKHWIDAILQATNLAEFSGFSEYETLGTYLCHANRDEIEISAEPWEHRGYARGFTPQGLLDSPQLAGEFAFVGFEAYDAPSAPAELAGDEPTSVGAFLDGFFGKSQPKRNIAQAGANDGVIADPLRPFLREGKHMYDVLHQLGTCHHSTVFLDTNDGFVRHGHGPANLFLARAADGRRASLVHRLDDGSLRGIRIPPGGAQPAELHELAAAAQEWLVAPSDRGRAALFSSELFLCAESDGTVTLSRSDHEAWERFWFEPAVAPGMLSDRVAKQQRIDQADILSVLRLVRPHSASRPKIRLGSLGDGGYVVPDDLAGLDGVISLGIGDEVSFDLDLAERGCRIFQYDPTVDGPPKPHANFHFERVGWARHDSGDARCLATMLDENHLQDSTDLLLKFDVEDAEWDALQSVAIDDLAKFRVIVGEFHGLETLTEPNRFQLICQAFERLTANHVVTHVHPNNNGGVELVEGVVVPRILEITFLRRDRATFIADHQPIPTPLDYANVPWKREIVMTPFD